jgi:hypothetical protein
MARQVKVAAAQMGPINEGTSRDEVVDRMLVLLEQAITEQVELIAYPEMALTTYFPKRIRDDYFPKSVLVPDKIVGIDLITVEARIVIASIDTYLKYAEAVGITTSRGYVEVGPDLRSNVQHILADHPHQFSKGGMWEAVRELLLDVQAKSGRDGDGDRRLLRHLPGRERCEYRSHRRNEAGRGLEMARR